MEKSQFKQMVSRLEVESAASPLAYQGKVAALAVLGFVILGLIIGCAGVGLLLIAGICVAIALSGGKAFFLLFKLGKLLFLLALPLWWLVKSSGSALLARLPAPQGLAVTRPQAPALFAALDDIRHRMRGPRFHHVLLNDEMNAAMVQRPLFGLVGWPRNYLMLGLPLLKTLTPDEAVAVVAHEYGHLAGSHSRFGAFIYRLRLTWTALQQLSEHWKGWASRPLRRVVQWYAPYFNAYTFVLARANEYQADAASAQLVGAAVAASALKRVNISSPLYEAFVDRTFATLRDADKPPQDLAMQWAACARQSAAADELQRSLSRALRRESLLSDTHPVLRERLRALPGQAERSAELPAPLDGSCAAVAWFGTGLDGLRAALQQRWHERVAPAWAQRHQELQTCLRRLEVLEAAPEPTLDEEVERWRLRVELWPERPHADALAAFNASHPDQAVTLYLEARVRLDADDASGVALMERVMALDPGATKPACERVHAHLLRQGDARAGAWAERWSERDAFEQARERELHMLDDSHELRVAELSDDALARVKALLQASGKGIVRAYLARRVLPSDPSVVTHVLGLELSWWTNQRGGGDAIVDSLMAQDWPLHVLVCALDADYSVLGKKLKALPTSPIEIAA